LELEGGEVVEEVVGKMEELPQCSYCCSSNSSRWSV
jgi:hypothetical protein